MLTRNLLSRQSRHVARQTTTAAGSVTKSSNDPWDQIFNELPDGTAYSSLLERKPAQKQYFTKNSSRAFAESRFFSRNPLGARHFSSSAALRYWTSPSSNAVSPCVISGDTTSTRPTVATNSTVTRGMATRCRSCGKRHGDPPGEGEVFCAG